MLNSASESTSAPPPQLKQRMPSIIEKEIVKNMSILDRSTLRLTGHIGRDLADLYPYQIHTLFVFCNSTELKITIKEEQGRSTMTSEVQEDQLLTILNNPNLRIQKLCLFTRRGITGNRIQEFIGRLRDAGIQRNSLNVQKVKFGYDIFIKTEIPKNRGRTEAGLKEMLELCVPGILETITLDVDFIDVTWTDIVDTAQWRRAANVRVIGK